MWHHDIIVHVLVNNADLCMGVPAACTRLLRHCYQTSRHTLSPIGRPGRPPHALPWGRPHPPNAQSREKLLDWNFELLKDKKTHSDFHTGRKRLPVAVALKFTVHAVQSFIKGHRKSGVISIKHSRDITNRISPLTVVCFLPVTVTHVYTRTHVHIYTCTYMGTGEPHLIRPFNLNAHNINMAPIWLLMTAIWLVMTAIIMIASD